MWRRWCTPLQYSCLENPMHGGAWSAAVHGVTKNRTRLSDFTLAFHFPELEKEMATHSSVLAWRIPGAGEPGGLPSMGSHRVGHDWSDLAAAAATTVTASYRAVSQGTNPPESGTGRLPHSIYSPHCVCARGFTCIISFNHPDSTLKWVIDPTYKIRKIRLRRLELACPRPQLVVETESEHK